MAQETIPGYDALGFLVGVDESEKFEHLLKSLWEMSTSYPALKGNCGTVSDDYFRVWTHIFEGGVDSVLEVPGVPGLVGTVEDYLDTDLVKTWIWDSQNPDAEEPLYPICFRSPLPWHRPVGDCQQAMATSITVLGRDAKFFDSEEGLAADPDLGKFAAESVVPVGMFVEEGETPGPAILVVGKVLLAVPSKNSITEEDFHALRVRTLGGEVWVALPKEAITEDVNGKIIAVQGMATGTIPDAIPEPVPDRPEEEFTIDDEAVLNSLRTLCVEFFKGPKFQEYFEDIHCDGFTRVLAGVFGIFSRDARLMTKRRGKTTPKMARRYREAAANAPIVMARIVMANTMVLYEGKSSPALVVVAFGDGADEAMTAAREVLARVHFGECENDQERELAKQIEDETYHFGKRRGLPAWLVGDVEAYAADLWIPGVAAHEEGLFSEVLVCLAEPGLDGLTAAIPAELIQQAIDSAKR